jgi:acyl-coenzyme A synthetase/AMP-(fatty) acid ligase
MYSQAGANPEEAVDGAISALEILHAERAAAVAEAAVSGGATEILPKVVDCVSLSPMFLEYLAKHPAKLAQIVQKADALRYGGGSISRTAGDIIINKAELVGGIGSTEQGVWACIQPTGDDLKQDGRWTYMTPHPALNFQFHPVSEDDGQTVFEAVMVRNNGIDWDGYVQPMFKVFPHLKEKNMGDLFVRHPERPNLWKHHGRADDLLNFLSGEKFFPIVAEQRITAHPGIAEAIIVGTRRPKASLIIRLEKGVELDDVWERIEEVNANSTVYARVTKDMVVVTEEPFLKTAKGSIRKANMLKKYSKELDRLYGEGE